LAELRRVSFGYFPEEIPAAKKLGDAGPGVSRLATEDGIEIRLRHGGGSSARPESTLLVVLNEEEAGMTPDWLDQAQAAGYTLVLCEPRGIGATKWTRKNPPNYVERCHALLGRTVDAGRVWDVVAAAKYLSQTDSGKSQKVYVAGKGMAGLIAAYAAALDDSIAGATLVSPPTSHMDAAAPQFLNVLRVCDVPDAMGLIAPRPLTILGTDPKGFSKTGAAYAAAGASQRLSVK
jgi:pimeloyl-ACP methyl ester carboxylesterase